MKTMLQPQRWNLSLQNILLTSAIALGVVVMGYNGTALIHGVQLVWQQGGYAALVLVPLTLLLAASLLCEISGNKSDRKMLTKRYSLIAALAPMAGFLGTIFGIMKAIHSLGEAENAESLIAMVSQTFANMSEAFTTTAWGLVLAMVAVFILKIRDNESRITDHEQRTKMIFQLQEIASSLNDMRPTVRQSFEQAEDNIKGEDRYAKIQL